MLPIALETDEQKRVHSFPVKEGVGTKRLPAIRNLTVVLTTSIVATVGIGLGWLLLNIGDDALPASSFVKVEKQRLLATAPLKAVLETVESGALAPLGGGKDAQFRAKMTFQNESRDYCRQYELAFGARQRMTGIACRLPSGDWSVVLQSLLPPSASGVTVPASAEQNAALDAATGALIHGDPLVGEAEAAIMRNGWRK
jgi:hypothetical protein